MRDQEPFRLLLLLLLDLSVRLLKGSEELLYITLLPFSRFNHQKPTWLLTAMNPAITTQVYLEMLGFYANRITEYQLFCNDFERLTRNEPLTLEQFKVDCLARGRFF